MIRFKNFKIASEFDDSMLETRLRSLINMADEYSTMEFGKDIVITGLLRTQQEQNEIYKKNPDYIKKPWKSVHQYGRGCDLRSSIYTSKEIAKFVDFLNMLTYDPKRPNKKTCTFHNVGKGDHLHLQVSSN